MNTTTLKTNNQNSAKVKGSDKEGFKHTEVGWIPEDWKVEILYKVGAFYKGRNIPRSELKSEGVPCVLYGEIYTKYNNVSFSLRSRTSVETAKSSFLLKDGDVLFAGSGETAEEIGKCFSFLNNEDAVAGGDIIILRPSDDYSSAFLGYSLNSPNAISQKSSMGQGSSVFHIYSSNLKKLTLPLPPTLAEQNAIATALSDMDALIEAQEQLIAKKLTIKQGAMQELLRPKEGWEVKTILEIADNKKELFDDGDWIESEHITDSGVRLIQTGNIGVGRFVEKENKKYIFEKSFQKLNCKEIIEGDLLICRLADPAGRACVLPNIGEAKSVTSVDVTIFRPRKEIANRVFLENLFSTSEWFQKVIEKVGGTTHKRISRSSLGKIQIHIPDINEQNRIARILSDMDIEIEQLETELAKLQQLKAGMMQELLTGKKRLI